MNSFVTVFINLC